MTPIPLTSFRILTKKFGWKKSFDEIVSDDEDDYKELIQNVMDCHGRLFDSKTEQFGEFTGATKEIMALWYKYFAFIMRANVKASWISIGTSNRGIPISVKDNYRALFEDRKVSGTSVVFSATKIHLFFLVHHLEEEKEKMGMNSFFDLIFEETYVPIVEAAHRVIKSDPFFSDQTLDLQDLIRKLRVEWIAEFKSSY
jgi:hypothetical protein